MASVTKTGGVKIGYVTVLWLLLMSGMDDSVQITRETKFATFDMHNFVWVAKNFSAPEYYPARIFDAEPPLVSLPTLQTLSRRTQSDQEIIRRVVELYSIEEAMLREKWQESDSQRLRALFVMNLVHVSHPYGSGAQTMNLSEYVQQIRMSNCGLYAEFQSRFLDAFKLSWRLVEVSSGFHGWIEVKIGDQWEIFDATANVWIDHSAFELLDGQKRRYRLFYTPWSDANRPDARQYVDLSLEPHYYTTGALRSNMPGFGIYFMTQAEMDKKRIRLQIHKSSCGRPTGTAACVEA